MNRHPQITAQSGPAPLMRGGWSLTLCSLLVAVFAQSAFAQTEVGVDDFRISTTGPDGDPRYDATSDGLAFDSKRDRYLVVWDADDRIPEEGPTFNGKREVFGQLVGGDGQLIGPARTLATLGPVNDPAWDAENPEVIYSESSDSYLLVFVGTVNVSATNAAIAKTEIFVQPLAVDGTPVGGPQQLSSTGPVQRLALDSKEPSLALSETSDRVLVAWQRELVDNGSQRETEVFARLVALSGDPMGASFRVSDMGPNGNTRYDAFDPDVTWASGRDEFLVVWRGDDNRAPLVNGEFEIFGQRINREGGSVGANDFRISFMGPNGNPSFRAEDPAARYSPEEDRYLVTWTGRDSAAVGEEVYGALLSGDGSLIESEIRISSAGSDGTQDADSYTVDETLVVYNQQEREFFVVWKGEDDRGLLAPDEFEVFGQRISLDGEEIGIDDVRLTSLGTDGDSRYDPVTIGLEFNPLRNEYFLVLSGDDSLGPLTDDEMEIFGQRVSPELSACTPTLERLCLAGGRFAVEVSWRSTKQGTQGVGQANPLSSDTGWFWFFTSTNVELIVKVLDARVINDQFWVFYGALTDVEFALQVTDTETGEVREYRNPEGSFASAGDVNAFPIGGSASAVPQALISALAVAESFEGAVEAMGTCVGSTETLCLNQNRFKIEVDWVDPKNTANRGSGVAEPLTTDTGWFWFFNSANTELMIKVLDARAINNSFWVFYGALSDVEYTIRVTDTVSGAVKEYFNPGGTFASNGDVNAFPQ